MARKRKRKCWVNPAQVAIRLFHQAGFSAEWIAKASIRQMYAVAKEKGLI